ncbi:MAG: hypothetical protein R3Y06_07875 [Faecalibacterium sp.]
MLTYAENTPLDIPQLFYLGEKFTLSFAQEDTLPAQISLCHVGELVANHDASDMTLAPMRQDDVVDFMPVATAGKQCFAFGYYTDTQNRNSYETPILKEEFVGADTITWASGISIEGKQGGFILVKESHKCVNQSGVFTGMFCVNAQGVSNTGWTVQQNVSPEEYRWCWADWAIGFAGGEQERQLAVKAFDRLRYPVKIERDLYTVMCTWGNSDGMSQPGRAAATQEKVLYELDYVKEAGIDMLLIFANLSSYTLLNSLKQRMRDFMLRTNYNCEVSWDTTEVNMRYGYFWAREFGNVHFMNRKPKTPVSVIYKPYTALKDFWQLAKYQNLNKWQLTIQNPTITI